MVCIIIREYAISHKDEKINPQSTLLTPSMNFMLGASGKNEVSVYHRIGHAFDPSLSKNCYSDVSIDENALVQQSQSQSQPPDLDNGQDIEIRSEPFPGMVLHVQNQNDHEVHNQGIEKRGSGILNIYHKPYCQNIHLQDSLSSDLVKQYELVEVLRDDLGTTDIHSHDFAYRPVVALPYNSDDRWKDDEYWWDNTFQNYERMGERAFAGGSHGEVWKAKRRCNQVVNVGQPKESSKDRSHDYHKRQNNVCDEGEGLILKRLRVGKSYALMEAGLREIYFGDIVARNEESAYLFTTYFDHFFHGLGMQVELWIVFGDAGPSLRSYLYSPLTSGDFVVYQHSAFWTRLRTGKPINEGNDSSSSVALAFISSDGGTDHVDVNKTSSEGDTKEESDAASGKELLKSILQQLLTSAAKLHERGIVHRDIKPSNIMCKTDQGISYMNCVLGDFSSAYDEFSSERLYSHGPSEVSTSTFDCMDQG